MAITGRERYYAQKKGLPGFAARATITDDLIQRSLASSRASREKIAQLGAETDVNVAKIGAESRERVAGVQSKTALETERLQQAGATARQRVSAAGDLALQALQGGQASARQRASDIAAAERIKAAGEETRKTKKRTSEIEREDLDYFINKYGADVFERGGSVGGYSFNPSTLTPGENRPEDEEYVRVE